MYIPDDSASCLLKFLSASSRSVRSFSILLRFSIIALVCSENRTAARSLGDSASQVIFVSLPVAYVILVIQQVYVFPLRSVTSAGSPASADGSKMQVRSSGRKDIPMIFLPRYDATTGAFPASIRGLSDTSSTYPFSPYKLLCFSSLASVACIPVMIIS